jgi:phage N-6-adenine-methyltransferase
LKPTQTIKHSFQNGFGKCLKLARKSSGLTQTALAEKTGLSRPAIRLLERGRGNLVSWNKVLAAERLVVQGRNLPAGDNLGRQIAMLRKRRGLGQRELAKLAGVTQPTIVRLELAGGGRLDTLERVLTVLGAGATLMRRGTTPAFYVGAGNSSLHHGWETPEWLLQILYGVFGTFDLDPCSPTHNRQTALVQALVHYTMIDNGLSLPWHGKVFVNPPYGRTLRLWTAKAKTEVAGGQAQLVVGLVPARTDTRWWHEDIAGSATVFFLRGRLSFGDLAQAAPFPSALAIWGGSGTELTALGAALPDAWQPSVRGGAGRIVAY